MRVLFVILAYPPMLGGIATHVGTLAKGLADEGVEVKIILAQGEALLTNHENLLNSTITVEVYRRPSQLYSATSRADIIHMNGFWTLAVVASLVTKTPLIWTHHEYDTICPIGVAWHKEKARSFRPTTCAKCMRDRGQAKSIPRRFAMLPIRRLSADLAAFNVVPSGFLGSRLSLPRTEVIPHSLPGLSTFRAQQMTPQSEPHSFVFVGRLVREKGCELLLDAIAGLRAKGINAVVEIVGSGPLEAALQAKAERLGLGSSVIFRGSMNQDAVNELLRSGGFRGLVIPSIWDEVFGLVAIEGMRAGVPIIASDVGGLGEVVKGAGLVFRRNDLPGLMACMEQLATSPAVFEEVSTEGRAKFDSKFTIQQMVNRYIELYSRAGVDQQ